MTRNNSIRLVPVRKAVTTQTIDSAENAGGIQVPSVIAEIAHRFESGAQERYLAKKLGVRRPFIEAVIRREFRALRQTSREQRDLIAQLSRRAA